ncbi:hypothetical protein AAC387_Pa12g1017 [Persea americana]
MNDEGKINWDAIKPVKELRNRQQGKQQGTKIYDNPLPKHAAPSSSEAAKVLFGKKDVELNNWSVQYHPLCLIEHEEDEMILDTEQYGQYLDPWNEIDQIQIRPRS